MADSQVEVRWTGEGLRFEAEHASHNTFRLDGEGKTAHSPVQALLLSLAGCTAADVIDILTKSRVPVSTLQVRVEGDRNADQPRYFTAIRMRYIARGIAEADRSKLERAVQLSHEKYCSVFHSLRTDIEFSSEIDLA